MATDNGCILSSDDDVTSSSKSMGVLAGGANRGCYRPSLVPVLPQPPGVLSTPSTPDATALTEETKSNSIKANNTGTKWENTKSKLKAKPTLKPAVNYKNCSYVHNCRTQYSAEQF